MDAIFEEETEAAEWHFTQSGRQAGPVTWPRLREPASSGALLQTDMVWKPGMATWAAAGSISGLFPKPARVPPPLPPAVVPPALPSRVVANRVTGELNLVGKDGGSVCLIDVLLDGELIGAGAGSWRKGINRLEFETTVGHHSITLRDNAASIVRVKSEIPGFLRRFARDENNPKEETYNVEMNKPGHYTLNFKRPLMKLFPTGIEITR